jgi:hypothetical protein
MKHIKKFNELNENKERWNDLVSGENTYQKNKPRHPNYRQQNDELGKTTHGTELKRQFDKIRKEIYKNFRSLEIKPVFSDIRMSFIEDVKQYYSIGKPSKSTNSRELEDTKDGDIEVIYNDEHYLFRSNDRNGDTIAYEYISKKSTKHNVSNTQESKQLIRALDDMMRGFEFSLTKEQVPAKFRFTKRSKYNEKFITEDGDGGGGASAGAAGSGDASGGVAYATKGGGLGAVKNATVSQTPGDPNGSTAGSGDVGFVLPDSTYTSKHRDFRSNNTGITGNTFTKLTSTKMLPKANNGDNNVAIQTVQKMKDKLGIGKVMSFQSFLNK